MRFAWNQVAFLLCLTVPTLWSCEGTTENRSDVLVTRGVTVNEDDFKAVVELIVSWDLACTGTFLSDNVLVTAAHCIEGDVFLKMPEGDPIPPVEIFVPEEYKQERFEPIQDCDDLKRDFFTAYDVAILVFPPKTAEAFGLSADDYFSISDRRPEIGSAYHFIGFGSVDANEMIGALQGGGKGIKRMGENQVEAFLGSEQSILQAASTAYLIPVDQIRLGDNSSEPGDSGGPVFWPGSKELIGITSTGLDIPFCEHGILTDFIFSFHSQWAKEELLPRIQALITKHVHDLP